MINFESDPAHPSDAVQENVAFLTLPYGGNERSAKRSIVTESRHVH